MRFFWYNKNMLVGHKKQWEFLKNSLENEKLAHAFLFCGENQIGKKTFAIEFVKLLNCTEINKPCQKCKNCLDIEKGNFPDFLFVRSGEESVGENNFEGMFSYNFALPDLKTGGELKDKKEIEITQARKALEFLSLRSYFGYYKAVVIDNAEKLTTEAQNCLLKTLEESKGKTVLILVTSQPERLLPTIFSRCQTIKFFSSKEILEKINSAPAGKKKLEEEQKILNDLLKVLGQNLAEKFAYAKSLKDDPSASSGQVTQVKEILEILQKYFRNFLLQKVVGRPTSHQIYPEPPENIKNYSTEKLSNIIKQIEKTIGDISFTNVSQKLALEILLMEM